MHQKINLLWFYKLVRKVSYELNLFRCQVKGGEFIYTVYIGCHLETNPTHYVGKQRKC